MKQLPIFLGDLNEPEVLQRIKEGHSDLSLHFHQEYNPNEPFKRINKFCFWDIPNINAICRPGTYDKYAELYVKYRNSDELPEYCTDELFPILNYTAGMILYRQQIEEIMMCVLNIDKPAAAMYIKVFGKRKTDEVIETHQYFIQKAIRNNYSKEYAEALYKRLFDGVIFAFDRDYALSKSILIYASESHSIKFPPEKDDYRYYVDIKSSFYTFRNQVVERFGNFYEKQADMFFERACNFAKRDFIDEALEEAQFAFNLHYYKSEDYALIYLIGFLCELYIQKENFRKAKSYCNMGLKLLDPDDPGYENDLSKFKEMEEIIRGEEWKDLR